MALHALIILADGFEEVEAIAPIDILRRAGIGVTIAGLASIDVRGAHDIVIKADMVLAETQLLADALILPGGQPGTTHLLQSDKVVRLVQKHFGGNKLCCAICAAPQVLFKAGILAGKRYTCYPCVEQQISGATWIEQPVVRDGTIITSRGLGTSIDFGLEVSAALTTQAQAHALAKKIIYASAL